MLSRMPNKLKKRGEMQKKKINTKALTSFIIAFAFLASAISGIVLYLTPQGRIANWNAWTMLGLDKPQWGAVHTLFVLLLLITAFFHLFVFNWKVFVAYFKQKNTRGMRLKKELFISLVIIATFFIGTLAEIAPFGTVIALGEDIKEYWVATSDKPPVSHAKDLTLAEYTRQVLQVEVAQVVTLLNDEGIIAAPEDLINDIAIRNGHSPNEIHNLLEEKLAPPSYPEPIVTPGAGYGRMTFGEVCNLYHVDVLEAACLLQNQGIVVKNSGENIKAIAGRLGSKPIDIVNAVRDLNVISMGNQTSM